MADSAYNRQAPGLINNTLLATAAKQTEGNASLAAIALDTANLSGILTAIATLRTAPVGKMGAAAASGQIGAAAIYLGPVLAGNVSAGDLFLQFFDAAALPADGATPDYCIPIAAGQTLEPDFRGAPFASKCFWCGSTTQATKTITLTNDIRLGAGSWT